MHVVIVGDATLDVTVRGGNPVPGADRPAQIDIGPGGQGANVAVRLARRGHQVRLVTAIGTDPIGAELGVRLAAEGIEVSNLGASRTGIVVALVDASGERAMLSDRAVIDESAWSGTAHAALADADWIHVSGYPLADSGSGAALADILAARPAGTRCSVSGGSFRPGSPIGERLRDIRPDLLVFDRGEGLLALTVIGRDAPATMSGLAEALAQHYRAVVVITDGPNPVVAAPADGSPTLAVYPGVAVLSVDATGAGDALTAEIVSGLGKGAWPPSNSRLQQAIRAGMQRGAEVAAVIGAQTRVPSEDLA